MNTMVIKLVRWLTSWAWRHEIRVLEGIAILKGFDMDDSRLEVRIQQDPMLAQWVAKCFVSIVENSPNYTEMKFDLDGKFDGKWGWITVHIQKGNGKTPHQLRQEAEVEISKLREQIETLIA